MTPFIQLIITIILLVILAGVLLFSYVLTRYLLTILFCLLKLEKWRNSLIPGIDVLVIDSQSCKRRTVVSVNDTVITVLSPEGNKSGQHISNIYPITRYGTIN